MKDAGSLVIAGGNIFNADTQAEIFGKFIELAGGKSMARIAVIVAASGRPLLSFQDAKDIITSLGVRESDVVCVPISYDADALAAGWMNRGGEELLSYFDAATGVWITGGDQLRLTNSLYESDGSDTPVLARIRQMLDDGLAVGGTSAGAAIMGEIMIARGTDGGALNMPVSLAPYGFFGEDEKDEEELIVSRGLGFAKGFIVDQHFNRRARLWRLIKAMENMAYEKGFGISEDTAMVVDRATNDFTVLGSASVYEVTREGNRVIIEEHKRA